MGWRISRLSSAHCKYFFCKKYNFSLCFCTSTIFYRETLYWKELIFVWSPYFDNWQEISHINWDEESPDYLQHTANISSAKSTTFHCAFARQPSFTGKLYIERNSFLYGAHILIIGKKYPTLIGMKNLLIIFSTLQIFQLPKIQPFNVSLVGNPSLKGNLSFAERMA